MKPSKQNVVYILVLVCVPMFFSISVGLYLSKLTIDQNAEEFGEFYLQTLDRRLAILSSQVSLALSAPVECEVTHDRMALWPYIEHYATVQDGKILCRSDLFFAWADDALIAKKFESGIHTYYKKMPDGTADTLLVLATEEIDGRQGFVVLTRKAFQDYLNLAPATRYAKMTLWVGDIPMVGGKYADEVAANIVESDDHHMSFGTSTADTYVRKAIAMFVLSSITISLFVSLLVHILIRSLSPRFSLEEEIKRGLARKEFYLQYQPIYGKENRLLGFEALARWRHPKMGNVSPEVFIPEIEKQQLSMLFTRYVFEQAVQDMASLTLSRPYHLGVNVPPAFMCSDELEETLKIALDAFQRVNLSLTLEVTERQLLDEQAIMQINAARDMGVRVAIDDFGVGHTSLSMLQRLKFDYLKIDKCFVDTVGVDSITAPVLESIIELAHRLDVDIVAEGVENEEQAAFLADRGCEYQQGFFHDRPLSIEAVKCRLNAVQNNERNTQLNIEPYAELSL